MIRYAYQYKEKVNSEYLEAIQKYPEKYRDLGSWAHQDNNWENYELTIENSCWSKFQMISLNSLGKIIGFFEIELNRSAGLAENLVIFDLINDDSKEDHGIFGIDLLRFMKTLIKRFDQVHTIKFTSYDSQIKLPKYERLIKLLGGFESHRKNSSMRFSDGNENLSIFYEIPIRTKPKLLDSVKRFL